MTVNVHSSPPQRRAAQALPNAAADRIRERQSGGVQRGHQCEQECGAGRRGESERKNAGVEVEGRHTHERYHSGGHSAEQQAESCLHHHPSDREAKHAGQEREQKALSQQLAALHAAAGRGDREMVELLLKRHADPNGFVNASGNAAYAAKTPEIRKLLEAHGGFLDPYDLVWKGEGRRGHADRD